uniref:Phytocyanin domain-containing protein n=1 Tax=Leersia perrieri TaxID=77586 RepID=A0A0D9W4W9_9ORYZ
MARASGGDKAICILAFILALQYCGVETAAAQSEWPVGDINDWSFGVVGWPNYKPFKIGDVLGDVHVRRERAQRGGGEVSDVDYALCRAPANATTYSSGNDRVTLSPGVTFGFPGDCDKGMKIAVTAR